MKINIKSMLMNRRVECIYKSLIVCVALLVSLPMTCAAEEDPNLVKSAEAQKDQFSVAVLKMCSEHPKVKGAIQVKEMKPTTTQKWVVKNGQATQLEDPKTQSYKYQLMIANVDKNSSFVVKLPDNKVLKSGEYCLADKGRLIRIGKLVQK